MPGMNKSREVWIKLYINYDGYYIFFLAFKLKLFSLKSYNSALSSGRFVTLKNRSRRLRNAIAQRRARDHS